MQTSPIPLKNTQTPYDLGDRLTLWLSCLWMLLQKQQGAGISCFFLLMFLGCPLSLFSCSIHKFRKVSGCSHMISVRWRALASRKSAPLLVLNLDLGPSGASNVRCQKSSCPNLHVLVVLKMDLFCLSGRFRKATWRLMPFKPRCHVLQRFTLLHLSPEFAKVSKSRLPAEFNLLSQFEKHMRDSTEHDATIVLHEQKNHLERLKCHLWLGAHACASNWLDLQGSWDPSIAWSLVVAKRFPSEQQFKHDAEKKHSICLGFLHASAAV